MADYSKLSAAIADVSAKLDALLAKPTPVVEAPEEQHAVDDLTAQVESIAAKIPA